MKKIRRGNDFVFAWEIVRNGLPEDLSSVLEKHLYLSALGKRVELVEGVDYDITGNVVRIEITPAIANILGTYKAEFHYILPDIGLIDEDRKCAVDVDAFIIVNSTAQADDPSEFTVTSDMAIAFKGDKGDSSYQTWLDAGNTGTEADYLAWIQQPATDIEQVVSSNETVRISSEETRQTNETARISAETLRNGAEGTRNTNEASRLNAEGLRVAAETGRVNAEELRAEAETARNTAEGERQTNTATAILQTNAARDLANEKAGLAATATTEANTARDEANLAATAANIKAGEANTAAMAANTAAGLADTKISEMDTLMSGYDSRVVNLETGKVDKQTFADVATVKIKNLIENGDFRNGTTGWTGVQSVIDGWATCVSTKAGAYASADRATLEPFPANCILWASGTMRLNSGFDNTEAKTMIIRVGGVSSMHNFAFITDNLTMQEYANGTLMPFSIVKNISNSRDARVFVGAYVANTSVNISLKNLSLVNLTYTFGAGNEPTKEEFELLLSIMGSQYFEGEITIPAQKVMQWELALIRKNKNAIIALGGTII